jgi:hypothetical protein
MLPYSVVHLYFQSVVQVTMGINLYELGVLLHHCMFLMN